MVQRVSFVIRASTPNQGQTIQGQIEHVLSGTTAHFQDLAQLHTFIAGYLEPQPESQTPARPATGDRVSSMFSFFRRPEKPDEEQPAAPSEPSAPAAPPGEPAVLLVPADAPIPPGETPVVVLPPGVMPPPVEAAPAVLAAESSPPPIDLDTYMGGMLNLLRAFLPPNAMGLPANGLSLVSLDYRALGLGGRYGLLRSGGLDIAELRGGWLDAVVRFDIWGADPDAANTAVIALQNALIANGLELRRQGVLRLKLSATADGDRGTVSGWRKTVDYSVLYEYRYQDTDGAASLIARVPIDSETDIGAASHETTEVHDWMMLWDNQAAPALVITAPPRGSIPIYGLAIAAFLPSGGPAGQVTQQVVLAGVTQTTTFASLGAFLAPFTISSSPLDLIYPPLPLELGETQEIHTFQVGELRFDPPITLKGGDAFQISFADTAFPADNLSQVYLRVLAPRD